MFHISTNIWNTFSMTLLSCSNALQCNPTNKCKEKFNLTSGGQMQYLSAQMQYLSVQMQYLSGQMQYKKPDRDILI